MKEDQENVNISSVSSFLAEVLKEPQSEEYTYFYRGTSNNEWENIPSIYRKYRENEEEYSFIEKEKEIYYEMISRCPEDFKHCNTALDHLVMMQHYGVPTRLLDITENPLVALYFACKDKKGKNGRVDIFKAERKNIKQYNSDTAAIIANIAKEDTDFDISIFKFLSHIKKIISKPLTGITEINSTLMSYSDFDFLKKAKSLLEEKHEKCKKSGDFSLIYFRNDLLTLIKKIDSVIERELNYIYKFPNFDEQKNIEEDIKNITEEIKNSPLISAYEHIEKYRKFIHSIQEEKTYFNPEYLNLESIGSVIFIKPKQNNPHIIRQNGAFILFGIKKHSRSKKECPPIPDNFHHKINRKKVILNIPKEYKEKILKELEALSISEGHLFTDIDKVAVDVKKRYRTPKASTSDTQILPTGDQPNTQLQPPAPPPPRPE